MKTFWSSVRASLVENIAFAFLGFLSSLIELFQRYALHRIDPLTRWSTDLASDFLSFPPVLLSTGVALSMVFIAQGLGFARSERLAWCVKKLNGVTGATSAYVFGMLCGTAPIMVFVNRPYTIYMTAIFVAVMAALYGIMYLVESFNKLGKITARWRYVLLVVAIVICACLLCHGPESA